MSGYSNSLDRATLDDVIAFTPSSISGLAFVYDAANYNAGAKTWTDTSGNGRNLTTSGTAPTLTASWQNGLPGVAFTTGGLKTSLLDLSSFTAMTWFAVASDTYSGALGMIFEFSDNYNSTPGFIAYNSSDHLVAGLSTPANSVTSTPVVDLASPTQFNITFDRTAASAGATGVTSMRVSQADVAYTGSGSGAMAGGFSNSASLYVGARTLTSFPWNGGTVGAMYGYARALTLSEKQSMERYIAARWAVT